MSEICKACGNNRVAENTFNNICDECYLDWPSQILPEGIIHDGLNEKEREEYDEGFSIKRGITSSDDKSSSFPSKRRKSSSKSSIGGSRKIKKRRRTRKTKKTRKIRKNRKTRKTRKNRK